MRTTTCKKCGKTCCFTQTVNYIAICDACFSTIECECEYGFGPITPCEIYVGGKEVAKIVGGPSYRLESDTLNLHMDLQSGYEKLAVYAEATDVVVAAWKKAAMTSPLVASPMMRLFEIDLQDYDPTSKVFRRPSARGIILVGNRIAMVYSKKEKYYKFPGGGIHEDEDQKVALCREVQEETGLVVVPETIVPFGSVLRRQRSDRDADTIFEQENFYYTCQVEEEVASQNLDEYEKEAEFVLEYTDIDHAIAVNAAYRSDVFFNEVMISREKRVLEIVKERLL